MRKLSDIAKGIGKRLPVVSLSYYFNEGIRKDIENGVPGSTRIKKVLGHLVYAGVGLVAGVGYPIVGTMTGEWNPIKLPAAMRETDARISKAIRDYDQLENFIFGPEGIADFNADGTISPAEKARAYEEMGIGGTFVKERSPSFKQLSGLRNKYLEKKE